jgi:hypothetical protein
LNKKLAKISEIKKGSTTKFKLLWNCENITHSGRLFLASKNVYILEQKNK